MSQFVNGSYISESSDKSRVLDSLFGRHTFLGIVKSTQTASTVGNVINAETSNGFLGANAAVLDVDVVTVSGTTPTLVVNLQTSATATGTYATSASSASITATGSYRFLALIPNLFYRITTTVGGTTPSFSLAVRVSPFRIT